jgi:Polyketide cyclase / dehydrase and lipid transport
MAGHTDNSVLIEAPIAVVWDMTNDIPSWTQLFTEYAEATVVAQTENGFLLRLVTHPDEQGQAWSWVSERCPDPAAWRVRSHRVETGPFAYMNLEWEYAQLPGGTQMRWIQDFAMKPGAHLDDAAMAQHLNATTRTQMDHIKDVIEITHTRAGSRY